MKPCFWYRNCPFYRIGPCNWFWASGPPFFCSSLSSWGPAEWLPFRYTLSPLPLCFSVVCVLCHKIIFCQEQWNNIKNLTFPPFHLLFPKKHLKLTQHERTLCRLAAEDGEIPMLFFTPNPFSQKSTKSTDDYLDYWINVLMYVL